MVSAEAGVTVVSLGLTSIRYRRAAGCPSWMSIPAHVDGRLAADLVPDAGSGADLLSTAPAASVNPEPAPPVTFTGVGPMDSNPDDPADRTNR